VFQLHGEILKGLLDDERPARQSKEGTKSSEADSKASNLSECKLEVASVTGISFFRRYPNMQMLMQLEHFGNETNK